jgi:1,4-dihydroxy-6-naphthoate synthase
MKSYTNEANFRGAEKIPVTIAYSPDTDDAFMMAAMERGEIDCGLYDFTFVRADIEELNQAARNSLYDVTAISIAAYPHLADQYLLMPVGCSVGTGYGPAVVTREGGDLSDLRDLKGKVVAVPGEWTSAFTVAQGMLGPFKPRFMRFDTIAPAVIAGEVDAGILIHELQMDAAMAGLRKIGNLGTIWHDAYQLPLPLGGNAIRRSLGAAHIEKITKIMRDSIAYGLANRVSTLEYAIAQSKPDLSLADGDRYISMYVNDDTLEISAPLRSGIEQIFNFAVERSEVKNVPPVTQLMEGLYA